MRRRSARSLAAGQTPATILATALALRRRGRGVLGVATSRWVFQPLQRASGQQALVATVGLALFLQEFLRLTQGDRPNLGRARCSTRPSALARAGDFVVTSALERAARRRASRFSPGLDAARVIRLTRFGRRWRAYADDPLGAQHYSASARAPSSPRPSRWPSAFAGLSGFVMTMYYGSVGYAAATGLGLKALVAAILGGVGSIPGALIGGLLVGAFEAAWPACFSVDYRDVAVFSLLAITLVLKPGGLLGVRP